MMVNFIYELCNAIQFLAFIRSQKVVQSYFNYKNQILMAEAHQKIQELNDQDAPFFISNQDKTNNTKPLKKPRSRKAIRENSQKYHWRHTEKIKYLEFLISERKLFDLSLEEKRHYAINKWMSTYIKTRDSIQCHSHHQKIMKKYGGIDQAIVELAKIYGEGSYILRKRLKCSVKIQENSNWQIKQVKNEQQLQEKNEEERNAVQMVKFQIQQVKIQQKQD